jgi:hypothetical protein
LPECGKSVEPAAEHVCLSSPDGREVEEQQQTEMSERLVGIIPLKEARRQ